MIRLCFIWILSLVVGYTQNLVFHQTFWTPLYLGTPLNACFEGSRTCGLPVAKTYCRWLGFKTADHMKLAYNLQETRYFQTRHTCRHFACSGFQWIQCKGMLKSALQSYHYRKAHFVNPMLEGYRIAYDPKAAFHFCRWLGYKKAISIAEDKQTGATIAINNGQLCFSPVCHGFLYIDCFR